MSDSRSVDLVAIGELLIDLISTEYADDFRGADQYKRLPGGSPANLAANLVRLGKSAALVSAVGHDDAGAYLRDFAAELGLDVSRVQRVAAATTLILVTKSREVSNFEAYREADALITLDRSDMEWIAGARLVHTTAFALSKEPARSTILKTFEVAKSAGAQLSIDANYAAKIWPDREEAQRVISSVLAQGVLAKFSEVDYERLFGEAVEDPFAAGQRLLGLGAKLVCLTMGGEGVYVVSAAEEFHLPARRVEVKDTTGAGDAFWSGFLSAWLEDKSLRDCARTGRAMAEAKLSVFGPLPARVDLRL